MAPESACSWQRKSVVRRQSAARRIASAEVVVVAVLVFFALVVAAIEVVSARASSETTARATPAAHPTMSQRWGLLRSGSSSSSWYSGGGGGGYRTRSSCHGLAGRVASTFRTTTTIASGGGNNLPSGAFIGTASTRLRFGSQSTMTRMTSTKIALQKQQQQRSSSPHFRLFSSENNSDNDIGWDTFDPFSSSQSRSTTSSNNVNNNVQSPLREFRSDRGRGTDDNNGGWGDSNDTDRSRQRPRPRQVDSRNDNGNDSWENDANENGKSNNRRFSENDDGYRNRNGSNRNNNYRSSPRLPFTSNNSNVRTRSNDSRFNDYRRDGDRGNGSNGRFRNEDGVRRMRNGSNERENADSSPKINLRALDLAGFDHVYGLASVLNALSSNARDLSPRNENDDIDDNDTWGDSENDSFEPRSSRTSSYNIPSTTTPRRRDRKPEAQFTPYLLVLQSSSQSQSTSIRSSDKQSQASKVLQLAQQRHIPIAQVDKGVLNTLSNNRPHQGYVLRCGKLQLDNMDHARITTIPTNVHDVHYKPFWLVLDEVVDPQNLGALLRSAYFLGQSSGRHDSGNAIGVLVCSKNSAPLSPTVSAASAGALELMVTSSDGSTIDDETLQRQILYSTSNLPKTLSLANAHGCRIVGASSSVPTTKSSHDADIVQLYNLQDLPPLDDSSSCPTLLVLGSEGHGLRSLVALACTEFVRIPGGGGSGSDESETDATTDGGVDSLNVSVTGGILLWHFLRPSTMQSSLPPLT